MTKTRCYLLVDFFSVNRKRGCAKCKMQFDWGDVRFASMRLPHVPSGPNIANLETEWFCVDCVEVPNCSCNGREDKCFLRPEGDVPDEVKTATRALMQDPRQQALRDNLRRLKRAKPSRQKKARKALITLLCVRSTGLIKPLALIPKDVLKIIGKLVLDSSNDAAWDKKQLVKIEPPKKKGKK